MKKNKNNKENNKRPVLDLTSFVNPDMVKYDVNGSYTGVTEDTYYYGDLEEPVQDADDL